MAEENVLFEASEWNYKAEGNYHIVVANASGKVLRLRKLMPNPSKNVPESSENEIKQGLAFIEFVVQPLLRDSGLCLMPLLVKLSEKFITNVMKKIEKFRPEHRRSRGLDTKKCGVLMQDYCFLTRNKIWNDLKWLGASLSLDTVAVEIKLKKGFRPAQNLHIKGSNSCENICHFCRTQLYRVAVEKRFKSCSLYCPLDLFSGNIDRMTFALRCLAQNPQNNFRVFLNGELKFSQQYLDDFMQEATTDAKFESLREFISSVFVGCNPVDSLHHLICSMLLCHVCPTSVPDAPSQAAQVCEGLKHKQASQYQDIGIYPDSQISSCPPTSSVLGLILAAQRLNLYTIEQINLFNEVLKSKLSLPTGSELRNGQTSSGNGSIKSGKCFNKTEGIETVAGYVKNFLISKCFCDCSLMFAIKRINQPNTQVTEYLKKRFENSQKFASCDVIADNNGNCYLVSVAVVDTDPKPATRIPMYLDQHRTFVEWWDTLCEKEKD
nr:inositol-pentakisphosphate 2-kinase [Ciona intestinalis]|eukprot:XP_002128315.1 inositol-pentakisphosphate 2-kinase [Ciona intestinalis]